MKWNSKRVFSSDLTIALEDLQKIDGVTIKSVEYDRPFYTVVWTTQ